MSATPKPVVAKRRTGPSVAKLRRLIERILDEAIPFNQSHERWWRWRLKYYGILGIPPEPEYHILHRLGGSGGYYQKALADAVLRWRSARSRAQYIAVLEAMWELGVITDAHRPLVGEHQVSELHHSTELRLTPKGNLLLAKWRKASRGEPWRTRDRRAHENIGRLLAHLKGAKERNRRGGKKSP